jgi:hypothetical protein
LLRSSTWREEEQFSQADERSPLPVFVKERVQRKLKGLDAEAEAIRIDNKKFFYYVREVAEESQRVHGHSSTEKKLFLLIMTILKEKASLRSGRRTRIEILSNVLQVNHLGIIQRVSKILVDIRMQRVLLSVSNAEILDTELETVT